MKYISLLFLVFIGCGSTAEFVPDAGFVSHYPNYSKKDFQEVEILQGRPKKRITQEGIIYIRNFEGNLPKEEEIIILKKLLFSYQLDGAWIEKGEIVEVSPWIYQVKNSAGIPMTYSEGSRDMGRMKGIAFRYK